MQSWNVVWFQKYRNSKKTKNAEDLLKNKGEKLRSKIWIPKGADRGLILLNFSIYYKTTIN